MPDSFNAQHFGEGPGNWADAFAAMPLETPDRDRWSAIARALDARSPRGIAARRERRTNWLIGLASAAVLAMVVWAPALQWLQGTPRTTAPVAISGPTGSSAARMTGATAADLPGRFDTPSRDGSSSPDVVLARSMPKPVATSHQAQVDRERARRATDRLIATLPYFAPASMMAAAAEDSLSHLQAQSAQLETLVALARDDRVASASSVLLTGELDARIAGIDAALSQADLSSAQRTRLWQQRVDALQQLAGITSSSRWLAAHGYDAALVTVD